MYICQHAYIRNSTSFILISTVHAFINGLNSQHTIKSSSLAVTKTEM